MMESSSQQTRETLLGWDLLWYLVEINTECMAAGLQQLGMGIRKALVSSGCNLCYKNLIVWALLKLK